jgi:hypothetical protein
LELHHDVPSLSVIEASTELKQKAWKGFEVLPDNEMSSSVRGAFEMNLKLSKRDLL